MSDQSDEAARLAELAESDEGDAELARWLAERPELAIDLATARRVRRLLDELRAAELELPAGFEQRLLARVAEDVALRNLLDLGVAGVGQLLIELLTLIFGLVPAPRPAAQPQGG